MKSAVLCIFAQLTFTVVAWAQSPTSDSTSTNAFREALVSCYRSISGTVNGQYPSGNGRVITSVATSNVETVTFPERLVLVASETSRGPRVITINPSHVHQYAIAASSDGTTHVALRDYQSGRFTNCPQGDCSRRAFSMSITVGEGNRAAWAPQNRTDNITNKPNAVREAPDRLPQQELDGILQRDLVAHLDGLCEKERLRAQNNQTPQINFTQSISQIRSQIVEGVHCQTVARRYPQVNDAIQRFAANASPQGGYCADRPAPTRSSPSRRGRPRSGNIIPGG